MEEHIFQPLQHILVLEMVAEWHYDLVFLCKIWSLFNFIQLAYMALVV